MFINLTIFAVVSDSLIEFAKFLCNESSLFYQTLGEVNRRTQYIQVLILSFMISCSTETIKLALICNISVSVLQPNFINSTYVLTNFKIHLIYLVLGKFPLKNSHPENCHPSNSLLVHSTPDNSHAKNSHLEYCHPCH